MTTMFEQHLNDHINCFQDLSSTGNTVTKVGELLILALKKGHKLLICGNGGSASDSQHFAAEIIGRFKKDRSALPAIALTTDTSIITAIANDYSFDNIYSRQTDALGLPGDVLIGLSTSGNSENVVNAILSAQKKQMETIALTGADGGKLKNLADYSIQIPSQATARIQEAHAFILHFWADQIESTLFNETEAT